MACGEEIGPPEKNECGGYYCSPEHGHIDCEQLHKIMCPTCGEWFDCRSMDEVMFHGTDHKPRPDIHYSGSKRIERR